jgi:transitional endoplasmic reticulum ATPase
MTDPKLCPSQQQVVEQLVKDSAGSQLLHLWAISGFGRTTMLTDLQRRIGGTFVDMSQVTAAAQSRHPIALEDAIFAAIRDAFQFSPHVFVDDWSLIADVVSSCGTSFPRPGYLEAISAAIVTLVKQDASRRLIIGTDGQFPNFLQSRTRSAGVAEFSPDDYRHLFVEFGAPSEASIDYESLHRFAPRLNANQLQAVCRSCRRDSVWSTDAVLDYLNEEHLVSNVAMKEVAEVGFEDLIGMDDLIEQLMSNVVFPLENDALAQQYGLRSKRGVLLLGPPGTGKTTIGKALAHRLRGKFFLIDGTVISGTDHFYYSIQHIIHQAKNNAPAVVFIDDTDVIFENQQEHGLYRYLLTVLDGLESTSLQRVCIMMTAMELKHIPPALIRSGRVELWLETSLPNEAARIELLKRLTKGLPESMTSFDVSTVAQAADRCTPADLKRLVNDAKTAYAWAQHHNRLKDSFTVYMLDAIAKLKAMKGLYAQVRKSQEHHRGDRPVWFDVPDFSAT